MGRSAYFCATDAITTFASQAYGAKQYHQVGLVAQRAFVIVFLTLFLPVLILWCFAEPILEGLGQTPSVVSQAAAYGRVRSRLLIFALANSVFLKSLNAIGNPLPAMAGSATSVALAVPLGWLFIVHLKLGVVGAAYQACALEAAACCVYAAGALCSAKARRCFHRPSLDVFRGWRGYLRVAVPAFVMLMVEMLAWELLEFPAGVCKPSPEAALGAYTILYNVIYLLEAPGFGVSGGAGAVVGNALGAGDADGGRRAALTTLVIALLTALVSTVALFAAIHYGDALSLFHADAETTRLARGMLPELLVCVFAANVGWPLTGIIAGAGRQAVSSPVAFVCYFVVGAPLGLVCAFVYPKNGFRGLFWGITLGVVLTALANLVLIVGRPCGVRCAIDWEAAAKAATRRTRDERDAAASAAHGHGQQSESQAAYDGSGSTPPLVASDAIGAAIINAEAPRPVGEVRR